MPSLNDEPGALTASSAALGAAFVSVVVLLLDLLLGFPLEHVLALVLFANVMFEAHRLSLFNREEVALFSAVVVSLLVVILLTFSSAFKTCTADAMLFGHIALQIRSQLGRGLSSPVVCYV
jgi:uncharacterized membrane protein